MTIAETFVFIQKITSKSGADPGFGGQLLRLKVANVAKQSGRSRASHL